ncbi:MAG: cysteine desulfurase [Acidobacteriia bacterium]|nr:cysteine desulfurase [Terriglobia bacterium]
MASRIYFDHSATTPLDPRVFSAMAPHLSSAAGNPSSPHHEGRQARQAVEFARGQVAELLGADPAEILFTASGTEADNLALLGALRARHLSESHIITTAIEHPAVLETCRALERRGVSLTLLPVDGHAQVDPSALCAAIRPETRLVSVMAANNLVGTLQPIAELAAITKAQGALFHTDAVQAAGKIPLNVKYLPADLISLSAHKLHGPQGIGALYVRGGVTLDPILFGGGQERGLRPATENVAAIVGFGMAAALAAAEIHSEAARLSALRGRILSGLRARLPHATLLGHPVERLPGHLCLGFPGHEGDMPALVIALDEAGVAVSSSSACSTAKAGAPAPVLQAMGLSADRARGFLRVTLGRFSTERDADRFLDLLPQAVSSLPSTRQAETFSATPG